MLDRLDQLPRQVGLDPLTHLHDLPGIAHVNLHRVTLETPDVHFSVRQLARQDVVHLVELELVRRPHRDLAILELEAGVLSLEVEPHVDFSRRLVDAVADLVEINLGYDIEGWHR